MTAKINPKVRLALEIALALAIYSIIDLIFLERALSSGGHTVIGHSESDVWKHLWGAWWMHSELSQGHFPVWTDLQNFPGGGRLYIIDPLNAFCTALLMPLLGLVTAFNATQFLQLLAAGMATWGLARWISGDYRAALVAGAIYGFCPFVLSSGIESGIDETSNIAWLPLSVWGLLLCLNGKHPRWGVILGGCGLALAAIGSWYYGMTAAIFWIITALWAAFTKRTPAGPAVKPNWIYPIMAGMLSLLLALPLAVLFAQSLKGENSLLGRVNITERQEKEHLEFMYRTFDFKNNAILTGYFQPGKNALSVATDVDRRLKTVYIGLLALTLAAWGLWKEGRSAFYWAVTAIVMGALSLGPYCAITQEIAMPRPWSPLYIFAYYVVPGFRMVAICDRLSIGVQLSVAMLATLGMHRLMPKRWWGVFIALIVTGGIIAEVIYYSPVPWPLSTSRASIPPVYEELAQKKERLGLIELPLNRYNHNLQPGEYYYWQTAHGKPLPATLTTRFSTDMMENRLVGMLYLCEDDDFPALPDTAVLVPGLKAARDSGFGWIVINYDMMTDKSTQKITTALTPLLGDPKRYGKDLLYDLHSKCADRQVQQLEKTIAEKATAEKAANEKATTEKVAAKKAANEKTATQKAISEKTAPSKVETEQK